MQGREQRNVERAECKAESRVQSREQRNVERAECKAESRVESRAQSRAESRVLRPQHDSIKL